MRLQLGRECPRNNQINQPKVDNAADPAWLGGFSDRNRLVITTAYAERRARDLQS